MFPTVEGGKGWAMDIETRDKHILIIPLLLCERLRKQLSLVLHILILEAFVRELIFQCQPCPPIHMWVHVFSVG